MRKTIALFLSLLLSFPSFGAIATTFQWEVRSGGNNLNGGGFDASVGAPGTDFSLQNAAQVAYTDLIIGATTSEYTSVLNPVDATLPGNGLTIVSGVGCTPGRYEVLSNATITATVDRSMGTAASVCVANLGGALDTPQRLNAVMATNQTGWVKNDGTYPVAAKFTYNFCSDGATIQSRIMGYTTTRGDGGHFILQASGSLGDRLLDINCVLYLANVTIDCNSQASTDGILFLGSRATVENIKVMNCTGFSATGALKFQNNDNTVINGEITLSSSGFLWGAASNKCLGCSGHDLTGPAFQTVGAEGWFCLWCFGYNITGATIDCFLSDGFNGALINGVMQACGRDGLRLAFGQGVTQVKNVAFISSTGTGLNVSSGAIVPGMLDYNAFFGNGTASAGYTPGVHDVTLTGDPFTNPAAGDFSLNNTAGAGAALKGVGLPGAFQYGGTGFNDIGPLQAAGGAATVTVGYPVQ